ncbi:MAG: laccase domain-containing protein [Bacteroidales bacterium]
MGRLRMITQNNQDIKVLQYENLSYCDIFHFITTRNGGVSRGNYASFNISPYSGDNPEHILQNQKFFSEYLKAELVLPYQTHQDKILRIDDSWSVRTPEDKSGLLHGIDALITASAGICYANEKVQSYKYR